MRIFPAFAAAAALALAACAKTEDGAAPAPSDPAAAGPAAASPLADPAAQPIAGEPSSAWIEMTGAWAREGYCDDDTERWVLEPEAFHLYEMHCPIERLVLLQNGVKATSNCTVEGDDDGVEDVFYFIRQPDASLTIVQGANEYATRGLFLCDAEETEL